MNGGKGSQGSHMGGDEGGCRARTPAALRAGRHPPSRWGLSGSEHGASGMAAARGGAAGSSRAQGPVENDGFGSGAAGSRTSCWHPGPVVNDGFGSGADATLYARLYMRLHTRTYKGRFLSICACKGGIDAHIRRVICACNAVRGAVRSGWNYPLGITRSSSQFLDNVGDTHMDDGGASIPRSPIGIEGFYGKCKEGARPRT